MARLAEKYQKEMIPALMDEFKYKSVMAVPKLVKIVLNIGLGEAIREAKLLDVASEELAAITGQKPIIRKARKAIAAFKLREGMPRPGLGRPLGPRAEPASSETRRC